MTASGASDADARAAAEVRRAAARRRRLAEVFGEGMPDTTSDEREPDSGAERAREAERGDTWLRDQVPPHHGG